MSTREYQTHSAEETIALGRTLAHELAPLRLVLLQGDLGTGKTTLVKGIAEGLKAADQHDVTSPTFTLIHEYGGGRLPLYHLDCYRLERAEEVATLGLEEIFDREAVVLMEWGERFPQLLPEERMEIRLETVGDEARRIEITAYAKSGS